MARAAAFGMALPGLSPVMHQRVADELVHSLLRAAARDGERRRSAGYSEWRRLFGMALPGLSPVMHQRLADELVQCVESGGAR